MIGRLRAAVSARLADAVQSLSRDTHALWMERIDRLQWCVRLNPVTKRSEVSRPQLNLSMSLMAECGLLETVPPTQRLSLLEELAGKLRMDDLMLNASADKDHLFLGIDSSQLTRSVLSDVMANGPNYGRGTSLYRYAHVQALEGSIVDRFIPNQTVVVEFSSPNIAKPFHAGHLRSTLLGQFISNINEWFGRTVVRINYLGDWGTQFGLLAVGFKKYGNPDSFKSDPLKHLFDVYVTINKEADQDGAVHSRGLEYFRKMEQGDDEALAFWKTCRDVTIEEYSKIYDRLGVKFTHIHGESMYSEKARDLIQDLKSKGLLSHDSETGVGFMDLTQPDDKTKIYGNLVKSDDTTLYLTRDVVAALDRMASFSADKLYYVVENGQNFHFKLLLRILRRLGQWWAVRPLDDVHIKFGRVEGMSTRRGEVVFLRDILDEAKSLALQRIKSTTTTKVLGAKEQDAVAEALGVSAVIVQDLKEYRRNNYKFSWERMLNLNGDTGVFLQYSHARLHSLNSRLDEELSATVPDFRSLAEDSAIRLVRHLGRFDEVLLKSFCDLEPCHLVQYLFTVGRLVNVALDELRVEGQPMSIAKDRLVLFQSAKTVLSNGLRILGITPLDRI